MVEVTVADATIRAVDRANNVVEIETVGWDSPAPELSAPFALGATISGRVTRLSTEAPSVSAGTMRDDGRRLDRHHLDSNEGIELSGAQGDGGFVWVTGPINTWIRFDADAEVEKRGDDDLVVSFSHPTTVTLGFQSNADAPGHTLTVPETPAGVATALSHFSAPFTETSPRRTSFLFRGHPPRVAFGEETDVPDRLRTATTSDVVLDLPPRLDALLPAAPLATYLGADVEVDPGARPTLRVPEVGLTHELADPPRFQHGAAALLRRVFSLDTLVRWVTESESDWFESDALAVLDLDPERCADLSLADRVGRYLSVDFERVSAMFPEWTSNVYANPTYESVRALPYLMVNLTQVYLPDAAPDRGADPTVDPGPRPRTRGPYVGWLGEDPLDDAYHTSLDAYRNRTDYLDDNEELSVVLASADPDRTDARDTAIEEYRTDDPPIDLSVLDDPTRNELVDALSGGVDMFHYVGPRSDGLACADGPLSPSEVPPVRTFFLDAPDSYSAGRELVSAGSVAGAVWAGVVDGTGAVQRNFLRTLVGGFTFDLGRRYAREFADGSGPLAVLGDGLHELVTYDQLQVFPLEIDPVGDGQFRVRIPCWYTNVGLGFGGLCLDRWHFGGNEFDLTLDASDIAQLLDTRQYVVVYDDEIHRSDELTPFDPTV